MSAHRQTKTARTYIIKLDRVFPLHRIILCYQYIYNEGVIDSENYPSPRPGCISPLNGWYRIEGIALPC